MIADAPLYASAGFLVGAMVGLTGVGGGSLMTPILMLVFGQPATTAVGTDLVFASITKLAATVSYGQTRRVDWPVVGRLAIGSLPASAAVILWFWLTRRTPGVVDGLVLKALAAMLVVTAFGLLGQTLFRRFGVQLTAASLNRTERFRPALTVATGIVLGVAVTLTSVGAGALGVVALLYLYPLRLTADRLVATDIAHALPLTLVAGLGHASLGHLDAPILGCLLLGSIPGVLLASRLTIRLPQVITRVMVATMLMLVGGRILLT
jgi:uncharacterized membrane protein YfcA